MRAYLRPIHAPLAFQQPLFPVSWVQQDLRGSFPPMVDIRSATSPEDPEEAAGMLSLRAPRQL